ncbi:GNAT family N-acetyltransferase [Acinetobacter tianfuensis]|uniref:GNAT family N-acetyltransferase n=1 Tax=Acinetobacter tianfuensis TaxID=2419603 RepID=A0A3A8E6B7_9GAMM|nr:GNAT family N-acetyltransferase [Acinetobacter tianfuensis]RKG30612.1 GNAT family N-acetyltransferase [Acinetobacter tianfuensis]
MNADALTELELNHKKIYRSKHVPNFHVRAAVAADDQLLGQLISECMPSNGILLSYERKPSYLAAAQTQYNRPDIRVVVPDDQPDLVVGMMNLGWKYCYINGQQDVMRYVGDLRLNTAYRGKKILRLLMDYLYDELPKAGMLQSIILNDNKVARSILHERRKGFPEPYHFDDIRTFIISRTAKPKCANDYRFEALTLDKICEANAFVQQMKVHYNFLPDYDFNGLALGHNPFWRGMNLKDFYLMYDVKNQLCGLYGLWNQKSFKQTRVVHYSLPLRLAKPLYNLYAGVRGRLALPATHQPFDYMLLHSYLCRPEHKQVFANMIHHAQQQTKLRKKEAFCLTLAKNDPRIQIMPTASAIVMRAVHSFHSFEGNPYQLFDRSKISYFDVGRI